MKRTKNYKAQKTKLNRKCITLDQAISNVKLLFHIFVHMIKKKEFLFLFVHRAEDQREWNSERQQQQQHAKKMLYEHNIKYKYSNRFQQSLKHVLFYAFAV